VSKEKSGNFIFFRGGGGFLDHGLNSLTGVKVTGLVLVLRHSVTSLISANNKQRMLPEAKVERSSANLGGSNSGTSLSALAQ